MKSKFLLRKAPVWPYVRISDRRSFLPFFAFAAFAFLGLSDVKGQNVTGFNYGTYSSVNAGSLNYGAISNPFTITYTGGSWITRTLSSFTPATQPASLSGYVQPTNMLELGAVIGTPRTARYSFTVPLPPTSVMFIQDVDALESFRIQFFDGSGVVLDPSTVGVYNLSSPAVSAVTTSSTSITVTATDDVNYPESLSTFVITSSAVRAVEITQIASRDDAINSGTAEFYFAAPSPPTANDDRSLNNPPGSTVTLNLLDDDLLGSGTQATSSQVTVAFTAPAGGVVTGDTITVPGQGKWTYNSTTGIITFVPEIGFTGNPTPVTYTLTENATGLTDQAVITVTYTSSLPVTLVAFNASLVENSVYLTWTTTQESNSDYFQIERSADGKHWIVIGTEPAMKQSQSLVQYRYWDNLDIVPSTSTGYYRLKMVDADQSFAYSRVRSVNGLPGISRLVVYPVPTVDRVYVSGLDISGIKEWAVTSQSGIPIKKGAVLEAPSIDLKGVPSGMYILRIILNDGLSGTQRILVGK